MGPQPRTVHDPQTPPRVSEPLRFRRVRDPPDRDPLDLRADRALVLTFLSTLPPGLRSCSYRVLPPEFVPPLWVLLRDSGAGAAYGVLEFLGLPQCASRENEHALWGDRFLLGLDAGNFNDLQGRGTRGLPMAREYGAWGSGVGELRKFASRGIAQKWIIA